MSVSEAWVTYLEANSTITALLKDATSIYPSLLPEVHAGYPALTYELSGDDNIDNLEGGVNELSFATIRTKIWDLDHKTVHDIATTMKSEVIGYRGTLGSLTAELISKAGEFDTGLEVDTGLYGLSLDFRIAYY